jgi:chromosome partitioning protein
MTQIIAIFSNKGGSGKTTIAVHLALMLAQRSLTALLDADPQATATEWIRRRPGDRKTPETVPCPGTAAMEQALALARRDNYQYVVLDLPPHSTSQVAGTLQEASLILIPVRPTAADLVTVDQSVKLVQATGKHSGFVLNSVKPNVTETKEIVPVLTGYRLPIIAALGDRIAYSRGLPAGLGGHELGDPQAEKEIANLAKKVREHLQEKTS